MRRLTVVLASDIRLVRSLADREARRDVGLFVVEGEKMVGEALNSGFRVVRLFSVDNRVGAEHVSVREMERLSRLKTASPVLALVEFPTVAFDRSLLSNELVLALDNIQDPGNLGAIIRTADWFGVRHIICSASTVDCFNPKVIQATMGAIFRVNVHYGDLPELLRGAECVYGAFLDGESIYTAKLSPTGVIVMGNEGQGISPSVASLVVRRLFIPNYPAPAITSESLNVSAATAITLSFFRAFL